MEPIVLSYQQSAFTHHYELYRTEESALLGGKSENTMHIFFSIHYNGETDNEGNKCFRYKVSKKTQSNHKGLYAWVEDLGELTDELSIGVSPVTGRIVRIYNHKEIYKLWMNKVWNRTEKQHRDEKKYDSILDVINTMLKEEEKLVHALCFAPPFSLLFAGIHGMPFVDNKSNIRKSRLNGMVGVSYLPIVVEDELIINKDNFYEIISEGKIDEKEFDKDNFHSFVRTLRDDPTAVSEINTKHSERYLFDENHWLKQAMWLNLSVVPDFMMREERVLLKEKEVKP